MGAWLLALLIGGWLAALAFTIDRLYEAALEGGLTTAYAHARSFEEGLTQVLQGVDLTLTNLDPGTRSLADVETLARTALRSAPHLRSLSLLDADGVVIASSARRNLGVRVDLDDFFPAGEPAAEVLRIGAPRPGRDIAESAAAGAKRALSTTEVNLIPVLRRLPGQPARWAIAAINPDHFIEQFTQLLDPHDGYAQVLRYDGVLLVSSGMDEIPGGRGYAGEVPGRLEKKEFGRFEQVLADGRPVLSAYRASSRFPALIAVHIDREQALAAWQEESRHIAMIFLPALAALSVAGWTALRRQARIAAQQAELHRQTQFSASVFDASSDAIILTRPSGEIFSCNPAFLQITGYAMIEVIGQNPRLLKSGRHDAEFYRRMWDALIRKGHWQGEIVNRRKDGSLYTGLASINAVRDAKGVVQHYVGVTHDVTERVRAQAAEREAELHLQREIVEKKILQEQAVRDPLTGLYNRRYLDETLGREIARARRDGHGLAVIMVDIDHFKAVNDTYGHAVGDEVIRMLGRILGEGAREGDVVCRYGGEEFVAALPRMGIEAAIARAEQWRLAASACRVAIGGGEFSFTLSAGVAAFPLHGADAQALVHSADVALYASKNAGRDRVTCCEPRH